MHFCINLLVGTCTIFLLVVAALYCFVWLNSVTLYVLNIAKDIITKANAGTTDEYIKYLNKVPMLDSLKDGEKKQMAENLTDFAFAEGETIFEKGDYMQWYSHLPKLCRLE